MVAGTRFNRLVVVRTYLNEAKRRTYAECTCDCGKVTNVQMKRLKIGHTRSCGCLNIERIKAMGLANKLHGQSAKGVRTREYEAWASMRQRCSYKKHPHYRSYGGRGIVVWSEMG